MKVEEYSSLSDAVVDLRTGFVRAVVYIPPDYSRRVDQGNRPRIAFIEDNTDNFVTSELLSRIQSLVQDLNQGLNPFQPGQRLSVPTPRLDPLIDLQVVELYPYIEYIKYLLSGSIAMSIFIVAMIGGGITFIDDKSRGLHEGYLVTPIKKSELILGLIFSGAIKGVMAGISITIIGGLMAGVGRLWDPVRLMYLAVVLGTTSVAMISFMFLLMVRVSDPLVPRAMFGVLNTLLYFPSGRHLSGRGISALAALDFLHRSVHLCRPRAKGAAAEEHGICRPFIRIFLSCWGFLFFSSACLSHFSGGRYKMKSGASFVGILDSGAEEPKSKALRYVSAESRWPR